MEAYKDPGRLERKVKEVCLLCNRMQKNIAKKYLVACLQLEIKMSILICLLDVFQLKRNKENAQKNIILYFSCMTDGPLQIFSRSSLLLFGYFLSLLKHVQPASSGKPWLNHQPSRHFTDLTLLSD